MNATQYLNPDGSPSTLWRCGKCGTVYNDREGEIATRCCTCTTCGTPTEYRASTCDFCREKRNHELEMSRFQKAEIVDKLEPDDWVCWGDTFNADPEALLEELMDSGVDIPVFFWVCAPDPVLIVDADRVIEWATDDAYEDFDPSSLNGIEEFEAACLAFTEANKRHFKYYPDYKRAILTASLRRPEEV